MHSNCMVTYAEYLHRILTQILESHDALADIDKTRLDISSIRRELLRITGSIKVILSSVPESEITSSDYTYLRTKMKKYLAEYDFEGEFDAMQDLYAEDAMRIKNLRMKIVESLSDRKMIEMIHDITGTLQV